MQQGQPVAFLSKALGKKLQELSIYEKEFLALIMAVEKWRHYLERQEFLIVTDYKSLAYLNEQNLHSEMQRKVMTRLMGLEFKIIYQKGKENVAADALSRVATSSLYKLFLRYNQHGYKKSSIPTPLILKLNNC
jgi:hypothetical protein